MESTVVLETAAKVETVDLAWQTARELLKNFATQEDYDAKMLGIFGDRLDGEKVSVLAAAWAAGDFSTFPEIEVRDSAEINGAWGAFAQATGKIYLSRELVNAGDVGAIGSVLLEEYGHYIDAQINPEDAPGDEGALFAASVEGKELSEADILTLKAEDDSAVVVLDGQEVSIEQQVQSDTLDFFAGNVSWNNTSPNSNQPITLVEKKFLEQPFKGSFLGGEFELQPASIKLDTFANWGDFGKTKFFYPVDVSVELPNNLKPGEISTIKTGSPLATSPSFSNIGEESEAFKLPNIGLGFDFKLAEAKFTTEPNLTNPWTGETISLAGINFSGLQAESKIDLVSILANQVDIDVLGGKLTANPPDISSLKTSIENGQSLPVVTATGRTDENVINLAFDLDRLLLTDKIPLYAGLKESLKQYNKTSYFDIKLEGLQVKIESPNGEIKRLKNGDDIANGEVEEAKKQLQAAQERRLNAENDLKAAQTKVQEVEQLLQQGKTVQSELDLVTRQVGYRIQTVEELTKQEQQIEDRLSNANLIKETYDQKIQDAQERLKKQPRFDFGADLNILDLVINLGLGLEQEFKFEPKTINVKEVSLDDNSKNNGGSVTLKNGENLENYSFEIVAPTTGCGMMKLTAKYELVGAVKNNIGIVLQGDFVVKGLEASGSGQILGIGKGIDVGQLSVGPFIPETRIPSEGLASPPFMLIGSEPDPIPFFPNDPTVESRKIIKAIETSEIQGQEKDDSNPDGTKNLIVEVEYEIPYNLPVSVSDASIEEGDSGTTNMVFPVTLRDVPNETVTLSYTSPKGSGSVTIPAGQTSGEIKIPIPGDTIIEPDETFTLTVKDQNGKLFADCKGTDSANATGTIINDDYGPPEPPQPEKRLPSTGDPHLVTLDGLRYDFQSAGEFILLKSTSGDLEVQVRQKPINDSVSVNTAVATKIDDKRVAFYLNENQPLLIDGQPTNITEGSYINVGSGRIYREGTTYTVVLNSAGEQLVVSNVDVNIFLAEGREGKVFGLGGNNNGKTDDDIALRDGTILSQPIAPEDLYGKYEDSWRISQAESLFDYKPGETTETFTNRLIPSKYVTIDDLDPADRQKAEQMALAAGITDPQILESTIIDLVFSNFDELYLQSAFNSKTASAALAVIIPPNATDDSANTTANTPVNIEVLLNDRGTIGVPLAINNFDTTTTAGGTLQRDNNNTPDDTSDDKLTYTPPVNFTGTDSFNYTLTDGTETDTAKVTITVPEFNLSTLNGGNGFVLKDAEAGSFSGVSVSKIGDFNGDNIDDLIVGAFAADPNGSNAAGKSFVVFGTTAGFPADFDLSTLNGSNGFVLNGIDAESFSGGSVSSAGDINNDGFDDVIVGAFGAAVDGKNNAGKTYILFGSNAGFPTLNLSELNGSNGFVLNGTNEFDYLGLAVSSAGDINDDGFDDILVGVPGAAGGGSGKTYILFGRSQGFAPSLNLAEINGENGIAINNTAANAGISVSKAGDINSDGIADLIIGTEADPNSANTAGESYVVFGSSDKFPANLNLSELNGSNGFILNGIDKNSGTSVSSAGDINGDGIDDLMVAENAENALGKSYIVFGSNKGFSASLDLSKLDGKNGFLVFNGIDGNSITSVNTAGDMNGDSIDDIALGVSASTVNDKFAAGKTYIMFGNNGGFPAAINLSKLDGSNGFVLNGAEAEDLSGTSVSEAGDINNDGTDDLVIGSPGSLFNNTPGKSYAVFGSNNFGNDASNLAKILFNPGFYLKTNPDVAAAVESGETRSASEHFNEFGFEEGRVPSAIFADYLNQNPDVAAAVAQGDISNGFEHFIKYGFAEGRLPNSEFSLLETFYLAQNPDVAESVKQGTFASGLEHLIRVGLAEGRNPLPSFNAISQTFNAEEYLAQNPDVAEAVNQGAFRNGFEHFVKVGLGEGRDPSSTFSNSVYLASYPDVAEAVNQGQFRNGFDHFMKAGFSEDRSGQAFTFAGFDGTFGAFEAFNIDPLTGSAENDILTGDGADNTLNGELTNDTLTGDGNNNVFALQPGGENQVITDFEDGIDFLGLANGVTFEQLAIAPGDGATLINLNGQPLASLTGVEASNISRDDFILI
ncbi:MAG TPA: FG-GAP repeat protein [Oscillatoriaceae cyanobacterium M33_DOE_052]|uniref:VWFD domain-containing protein n=1 Tax=Planktothricoides sp. SpSt-374 TaxID=2282167 RepID=A0A7C3VJU5_9CYAN|nr:FG-GAP repeat protein [Oscillatoriaceae cyanobacterium M33_DOE_052]